MTSKHQEREKKRKDARDRLLGRIEQLESIITSWHLWYAQAPVVMSTMLHTLPKASTINDPKEPEYEIQNRDSKKSSGYQPYRLSAAATGAAGATETELHDETSEIASGDETNKTVEKTTSPREGQNAKYQRIKTYPFILTCFQRPTRTKGLRQQSRHHEKPRITV